MLADVQPRARVAAHRGENAPSGTAGVRGGGGRGDLARVGERREVRGVVGGGVKALPQQRQGLGAVQRPGVDPGAPQRRGDLLAQAQALDRRLAVHRPRDAAARAGGQGAQLLAGLVEHRAVGHHDPPAGQHGGLLGAGGRPHRLLGGGQQPPPRPRERVVAIGAVLAARDPRRLPVGARAHR